MQLTYRGSVNRWECDENDHLNVRLRTKAPQTLLGGLLTNDCIGVADVADLPRNIRRQHIRFRANLATPLGGYFSAVVSDDFQVVVELRNEATGTVAYYACDFADDELVTDCSSILVRPAAIDHAWGRVFNAILICMTCLLSRHCSVFAPAGAGVIEQEECSADRLLCLITVWDGSRILCPTFGEPFFRKAMPTAKWGVLWLNFVALTNL